MYIRFYQQYALSIVQHFSHLDHEEKSLYIVTLYLFMQLFSKKKTILYYNSVIAINTYDETDEQKVNYNCINLRLI